MMGLNKFLDKRVIITCSDGEILHGIVTDYAAPLDNDEEHEGIGIDSDESAGVWLDEPDIRAIQEA